MIDRMDSTEFIKFLAAKMCGYERVPLNKQCFTVINEIPLTNQVRGPYWKLRTEFFSFDLWAKREARGP